ncbi:tetratricopeptide repeat protein, partial [Chloroflexota bacterium]
MTNIQHILTNAIKLLKAGKPQQAIPLIKQVLEADPRNEHGWFLMGMALQNPKQKEYAFNKVLEINPQNQRAIGQLKKMGAAPTVPPTSVGKSPAPKTPTGTSNKWMMIALGSAAVIVVLTLSGLLLVDAGLLPDPFSGSDV